MIRILLDCAPEDRPFVGWARILKGRVAVKYYSTKRLRRLIQGHALANE